MPVGPLPTTRDPALDPSVPGPVRTPDFFLLGAGKCGTTTLYHALNEHPEIFLPTPKEPSFFSRPFQVVPDPISYFRLFDGARPGQRVGDASHVYFSNPESAPVLAALFPAAQFVLILRRPSLRAWSLFQHMRRYGHEPIADFAAALAAEDGRYADQDFPRSCGQYFWNFLYVRSSRYDVQWRRYLRFFPRERFCVLSLAELADGPQSALRRIFRFLGVDPSFTPRCAPHNRQVYPDLEPALLSALDARLASTVRATQSLAGRPLRLMER